MIESARTEAFMKPAISACLVLLFIGGFQVHAQEKPALTARDYYKELKDANNFSHYKDICVCFKDDDVPSFTVLARGSEIIDEMKKAGEPSDDTMLKAAKFLFVETYYKGVVSNKTEIYEPVGTDGTDFDTEFGKPFHGKMVYIINWVTGRYRLQVFDLDKNKDVAAGEDSGKCELIHPPK
jgi:hypothetical protein